MIFSNARKSICLAPFADCWAIPVATARVMHRRPPRPHRRPSPTGAISETWTLQRCVVMARFPPPPSARAHARCFRAPAVVCTGRDISAAGTSYRILPDTYAMPATSGRGPLEHLVLNDSWVSVATGTEDLNFKTMRKNQYEESIFRAEDERFELDTTIETNMATIQMLQPLAAEIANLTEPEKRRYKLPLPLTAMHVRSIRRLYGAQGTQVIDLLAKCPAAAVASLVKRLQQKDEEWRGLRAQCSKAWKEVYEKNYTKSLDHRSFYFKQGDKKNFSGKQMVLDLKGLTEAPDETAAEVPTTAAEPRSASLALPFPVASSLAALHDDSFELMVFAAKLSFSVEHLGPACKAVGQLVPTLTHHSRRQVVEGEIEEKISTFWHTFVRHFFVCPELERADASAQPLETAPDCKPLLIVSADSSEEQATRDARPPESRWSHPLSYAKKSSQLFLGNSHFYIFVRLYHVILTRLAAAKDMASREQEKAAAAAAASGAKADTSAGLPVPAAQPNGLSAAGVEAEGGAARSSDASSRAALLTSLRAESDGDLYAAFQLALKQLIDGKMEASTYEDGGWNTDRSPRHPSAAPRDKPPLHF